MTGPPTAASPRGSSALASVEEIIEEARNGRMFIMVDDEDRENEGDLVIPAQMTTPEKINFMATHGRGLICLALTKVRADQLDLAPMAASNGTRHETAFTVSIEARDGVTTGISAADRARTVAVAIDASRGADQLVTPGHMFPLVARPGGVLVRAGHTEAAVDIARLAGLNPSGVICEIMNDDGTMARLDDVVALANAQGLKIGAIRDLIAFRRKHDNDIVKVAETRFDSLFGGDWRAVSYLNQAVGTKTVALVKGTVITDRPTLVRMHQLDLFCDTLGELGNDTGLLQSAMRMIGDEGCGVIVLINPGHPDALTRTVEIRDANSEATARGHGELRDYGIGAQILADLGVHAMVLISNNRSTPVALAGYGLSIIEERPLRGLSDADRQPPPGQRDGS